MGTDNDLETRLLDSCNSLYEDNTITRAQYKKCKQAMDDGSYTLDQERLTETNIFGTPRDIKESKFKAFLENIKIVMDETLEKWKKEKEKVSQDAQKVADYEKILNKLIILMENVIEWIQTLSIENHKNTEDAHYNQLVGYYTKIDNNRKELDKIQKQFNTLEQKSNHQDITKNDKSDSYMTQRNIMISLIIFLIICVVIIFLLYFI